MRYTDENYQPEKKRPVGAAFLKPAEVRMQSRKATERTIVRLLAKIFHLDLRLIGEMTRQETGKFDQLLLGVHQAYSPKFPADIFVSNPTKGKGQVFTLNRLLRYPERYSLISQFLALSRKNLKQPNRFAMLASSHPRLGLLAVTDLIMEPDILCFQFSVNLDKEGNQKPKTLVLADIKHLLLAFRRQEVWMPGAR